jgi:hypothetical protein
MGNLYTLFKMDNKMSLGAVEVITYDIVVQ